MLRRTALLVIVSLLLVGVSAPAVQAQGTEPTPVPQAPPAAPALPGTNVPGEITPELFSWYTTSIPNFSVGLLYFVLGAIGSLVTVYLFLGEFLPSMGGKGEYVKLQAQLEYFEDWRRRLLDTQWAGVTGKAGLTQEEVQLLMAIDRLSADLDNTIGNLRKQMSGERWRLFVIGFPLYVVLGGFFSAAFGRDILQALMIGFGWTAVAERFGASREETVRRTFRDAQIEKLREQAVRAQDVEALGEEVDKLRAAVRTASDFGREVRATAALVQARLEGTQDLLGLLQMLPPSTERGAALNQVAGSLEHVQKAIGVLEQTNGKA